MPHKFRYLVFFILCLAGCEDNTDFIRAQHYLKAPLSKYTRDIHLHEVSVDRYPDPGTYTEAVIYFHSSDTLYNDLTTQLKLRHLTDTPGDVYLGNLFSTMSRNLKDEVEVEICSDPAFHLAGLYIPTDVTPEVRGQVSAQYCPDTKLAIFFVQLWE